MFYQKPQELCIPGTHLSSKNYCQVTSKEIESTLSKFNLRIRNAQLNDVPQIDKLVYSRYSPEIASETSHFTTYRFIKYGNIFVIENNEDIVIACIYEQQLRGRISFAIRLIVDRNYEGMGLSKVLTYQTYVTAIREGSEIRHGIIATENIASHISHLNKFGWSYTGIIQENLDGVKDHFTVEIGLKPAILTGNSIDEKKLSEVINNRYGEYALYRVDDIHGLHKFFSMNQKGRVIALAREGTINGENGSLFVCKS